MIKVKKTYSNLKQFESLKDRYEYLKLGGIVGDSTFGHNRYLNQEFYRSKEWLEVRDYVIIRDNGCDLGVEGYEIHSKILVHHMNPITLADIENRNPDILNPEYLISTSDRTHQAIHFGDKDLLPKDPIIRKPNDTVPWKR